MATRPNIGVNVQSQVDKDLITDVSEQIMLLFETAFENHIDQQTLQKALDVLERVGTVGPTTVSGCDIRVGE